MGGLQPRHARLVVGASATLSRFLLETLDELKKKDSGEESGAQGRLGVGGRGARSSPVSSIATGYPSNLTGIFPARSAVRAATSTLRQGSPSHCPMATPTTPGKAITCSARSRCASSRLVCHRQAWAMLTRLAARAGRTGREGDEEQGGQDAKTSIVRRS